MANHNRYRWGTCDSTGTQLWSRIYDDFDECYEDYVRVMTALSDMTADIEVYKWRGMTADLAVYKWRGVFNLDQAALLVNDKNIYADRLRVIEGDREGFE